MANRPVYLPSEEPPFVKAVNTDFEFFPGFAMIQKRRNIDALQKSYLKEHPGDTILEISTKSPVPVGEALSPFNLRLQHGDRTFPVESAFQSSKRFEHSGPHPDLLDATARQARKDPRIKESGDLVGYEYFGKTFPTSPPTYFYDWLYINALAQNPELAKQLFDYNAFTDIEFNPKRSKSCQAHAAAKFVGMTRSGVLDEALKSEEAFRKIAYLAQPGETE